MRRVIKNVISIFVIIAMGALMYFTMTCAKKQSSDNSSGGAPISVSSQERQSSPSQLGDQSQNSDSKNQTPPAKPEDQSQNGGSDNQTPPAKPEDQSQNGGSDNQIPPAKSEGESSESAQGNLSQSQQSSSNVQAIDEGAQYGESISSKSDALGLMYYFIFAAESLMFSLFLVYMIISGFYKRSLKEVFSSSNLIAIFVASVIILTAGVTFADRIIAEKYFISTNNSSESQNTPGSKNSSDAKNISIKGANVIDGETKTIAEGTYTSSTADESVIVVQNKGNLTLSGATINKTAGDSSNTESSEFYGVNAGILVKSSSTAKISNCTISTNAKGSNAVFATGSDAKIYINDSKITTTGSRSARGLDATYGGYIEADNVSITTQGGSCATLATDRGEGTVIAKNSTLETNGVGSPIIYSTGDISISNTQGNANGSQMVVIEGKNSATVDGSTLQCSGKGNRNDVDNCGIMIYQSMSGDASEGTGTFTAKNSTLKILQSSSYYKTVPFFFITNTNATINLTNNVLDFGSGTLMKVAGTSEWGKSGSNGGNVTFNASNQKLTGNIEVDNISMLKMNLKDGSSLVGSINNKNTAKSISLVLDKSSKLTLTQDIYLSTFNNEDTTNSNINFSGYKIYVNGVAVN